MRARRIVAPVVGEESAVSVQDDGLDGRRTDVDAELVGAAVLGWRAALS